MEPAVSEAMTHAFPDAPGGDVGRERGAPPRAGAGDGLAGAPETAVEPGPAAPSDARAALDQAGTDPAVRALVRLGVGLLALAAVASVWFVLASQSPTAPYYVESLPGPVDRCADALLTLGFGALFAAWLLPRVVASGRWARALAGAIHVGALLYGAGVFLAALHGGYGIQLTDPRPRSVMILYLRGSGAVVLGLVLLLYLVQLARWRGSRR